MQFIRRVAGLLIRHPLTLYLAYVYKVLTAPNHVRLGHLATYHHCEFEEYVTLEDNVVIKNCKIGKFTYLGTRSFFSHTTIGRFCSITLDVKCGLGQHPTSRFVSTHPMFYNATLRPAQLTLADRSYFEDINPVTIGHDVWIGANAIIMDGVTIGDGSIIAAGCIVTKDVEPYSIVGGVPGRLIRKRFNDEQIAFLLDFKWWDKDFDWIRENWRSWLDIDTFMATHTTQEVNHEK